MNNKAIALSAEFNNAEQLLTVIKSVVFHNKNIDFYIFNIDFPREWFKNIRQKISRTDISLYDVKVDVDSDLLSTYKSTVSSIATYFRYFIPKYIKNSIVLYLDIDIIVTSDLSCLFNIDFSEEYKDYYTAAVKDFWVHEQFIGTEKYFNAGVLVLNNFLLRRDNMTERFLELTNTNNHLIKYGDQSILNLAFKDRWIELDTTYNFMVGADYLIETFGNPKNIQYPTNCPSIIHYMGVLKPWSVKLYVRYRDLWWTYHDLEWQELASVSAEQQRKFLILTASDNIDGIEELIRSCPNWHFYIAAKTMVSYKLIKLLSYENCTVYRSILDVGVEELVRTCDAYLDIHHGHEVSHILARFKQVNKPIFGYFGTTHDEEQVSMLVQDGDVQKLITTIQQYFNSPRLANGNASNRQ